MSTGPKFADAILPPTPERWRRGDVRRSDRQVQDAAGAVGDPFVTISALARLHRAGRITAEMVIAGSRFMPVLLRRI